MQAVTAFSRAVEILKPGATGRDIAALLNHRAERTLTLHWKAGRRRPPPWALHLLAAKIRASAEERRSIAEELEALPERPGLKAGARNLAEYLARR